MPFFPFAVSAVFGTETARIPVIGKGEKAFIRLQYDIAAVSAVTAVRAAFGYIFFSTEADATVATLSGGKKYFCRIYKFHGQNLTCAAGKESGPAKWSRPAVVKFTTSRSAFSAISSLR
jgi:hypothetical protein